MSWLAHTPALLLLLVGFGLLVAPRTRIAPWAAWLSVATLCAAGVASAALCAVDRGVPLAVAVPLGAVGALALCPRPRRPVVFAAAFLVGNGGLLALAVATRVEALLLGFALAAGGLLHATRAAGWGEPRARERTLGKAIVALGALVIGVGAVSVATGGLRLAPLAWLGQPAQAPWLPGLGVVAVGLGLSLLLGVLPLGGGWGELLERAPAGLGLWLCVSFPAAGLSALGRCLVGVGALQSWLPPLCDPRQWLAPLGVASATLALWVALRGTSLNRSLAQLAAAQHGLLLLALAYQPAGATGWGALWLPVTAALVTNGAGFALAASLEGERPAELRALVGLGGRAPWTAAMWGVVLASHAGIPCTVGFLGRLQLLLVGAAAPLWPSYLLLAALDLALAAAVALRLGRLLLHTSRPSRAPTPRAGAGLVGGVLTALVLILGLWPGQLLLGAAP